ncbi:hypothetical protein AU476_36500 [Cupriavidus sp. UYMSc13B]|nr:hypothetical protein AU476_36500 [Cupriavidus sp. UYMSc13B]
MVDAWLADSRVRKITFTGSTPVGKHLARESAGTLKKLPAAAAASKALPPRSSTPMAVCVASQCVEAATPKVPMISGRW